MLASPWVCVAASRARGTPVIGLRTQLWVCAAASRTRGTPAIGLRRGSFSIRACAPVVGDFATAMGFVNWQFLAARSLHGQVIKAMSRPMSLYQPEAAREPMAVLSRLAGLNGRFINNGC